MNKKVAITTLLLLIIAGFSSWFTLNVVKKTTTVHISKPHNPDAFMRQVTYKQFDENGKLYASFQTPAATHFPYKNSSKFQNPLIWLYANPKQAPWQITARYGTSFHGTTEVRLINNVVMHQAATNNNHPTTITTNSATIHLHQRAAETSQPITIIQPGLKITAIGAKANLAKKSLQLLSQVKETYDPTLR